MATDREKEWAGKASRFVKAELKRAGVSYKELARRLNEHGLPETEDSITSKLGRGHSQLRFSWPFWRFWRWTGCR